MSVGQMSVRQMATAKCQSAKCQSAKCFSAERRQTGQRNGIGQYRKKPDYPDKKSFYCNDQKMIDIKEVTSQ
jgi:hypothetical protein